MGAVDMGWGGGGGEETRESKIERGEIEGSEGRAAAMHQKIAQWLSAQLRSPGMPVRRALFLFVYGSPHLSSV
jgi:hypothetical protein